MGTIFVSYFIFSFVRIDLKDRDVECCQRSAAFLTVKSLLGSSDLHLNARVIDLVLQTPLYD